MITINLNSQKINLPENNSLAEVLTHQGYTGDYFAVALNRKFIARGQYAETILTENDSIDIIFPMQGG